MHVTKETNIEDYPHDQKVKSRVVSIAVVLSTLELCILSKLIKSVKLNWMISTDLFFLRCFPIECKRKRALATF